MNLQKENAALSESKLFCRRGDTMELFPQRPSNERGSEEAKVEWWVR